MKTFEIKSKIYFGKDSLCALSEYTAKNAVIFTDSFMEKSGNVDLIAKMMTSCENISVFAETVPDPPIELIVKALKFLTEKNADLVIALGGGSSIDAAKSTILMLEKNIGRQIPLIAVPTTSGTGSEVTKFAVITDKEAGVKYPMVSDKLLPKAAILAGELVKSVPATVTADTGFDVITHALEAYISLNANDFTDAFAEKALEICFEYLPKVYSDGNDIEAREKMHTASCLAGMAFNDASLGVNHGIAHALGAVFHIPHGRANAMMLYHVMKYNAQLESCSYEKCSITCEKMAKIAKFVGLSAYSPKQGAVNLINAIKKLSKDLEIPQNLADVGITKEEYIKHKDHIINSAVNDACTATNPVTINYKAVESILKGIEIFA